MRPDSPDVRAMPENMGKSLPPTENMQTLFKLAKWAADTIIEYRCSFNSYPHCLMSRF